MSPADRGSVLVTDSCLRTALSTVRSLGRRGVRVTVAERAMEPSLDLGGLSRYVSARVRVPDNRAEPEAWVEAILAEAPRHDVLLPMGMHAIVPVARRLAEFQRVTKLVLPPVETVLRADNTPELLELARAIDVPVPPQWRGSDFADDAALAAAVRFPAIVKLGVESDLPPGDRYEVVRDADGLHRALARLRRYAPDPLIQGLIVGDGIGVEALFDASHEPVALFAHRRLREYPLSGGPSTYCESIAHPEATALALKLLRALRWVGLAMVEFKVDAATGTPVLMEINPRPWGSMELPIRAGVDFPWLWYQLARDGTVTPQLTWPVGVRLRFIVNDLQAAVATVRRSPRQALAVLGSLLDPRVKEGVLRLDDPRPSLAYLTKAVARAVGRR